MKNMYVFVSASNYGGVVTAINIQAEDHFEALVKAYEYFGGTSDLKVEEFNTLCQHTEIGRMYEIFQRFTSETIIYFAERKDGYFVDELNCIQ